MRKGFLGSLERARPKGNGSAHFPAVAEVEAYWQALRDQCHIPHRQDLDPRGIKHSLSKAFILDCNNSGRPSFRIVGSDIGDLMKADLNGLPLTELVAPQKRRMTNGIVQDVIRLPAQAHLDFVGIEETGTSFHLRMVLLPMKDSSGQCSQVLGCLDFSSAKPALCTRAEGIILSGSIVRPLGREQDPVVRRMHHQGLRVVSSSTRIKAKRERPSQVPYLNLVTP